MKLAVVGCGHLGLPLTLLLAETGHDVTGIDTNPELLDRLKRGEVPWHEADLAEMLEEHGPKIEWRSDVADAAECEVSFVVVPTPSLDSGAFDVTAVESVVQTIGSQPPGVSGHVVCVVSTVNPGDCEPWEEALPDPIGLVYSPEFVSLGDVFSTMRQPDMLLVGQTHQGAGDRVLAALRTIKPHGPRDGDGIRIPVAHAPAIHRLSLTEAEIAKLSVNAYVTMKISWANWLGELCESYGARGDRVAQAVGSDTRIGVKYLRPGRAYGGPCFPRDNAALIAAARGDAPLAEATVNVNDWQLFRFTELVAAQADDGATVAVLGLSYKPGTAVETESFGVALARSLARQFNVRTWDPLDLGTHDLIETAVSNAAVVVLANDDPAFRGPFPGAMIVDCNGLDQIDLTGSAGYVRAGNG